MKQFYLKRFGFKFKMFIKNEIVVACMVRIPGDTIDKYNNGAFIGIAKVNKSDVYDYEVGKRIAIKSAINQYSSFKTGIDIQAVNGFRSQMREINDRLGLELYKLRGDKK